MGCILLKLNFTCPIYYLSKRQLLLVPSIISLNANFYLSHVLSLYMPTFTCPIYYLSTCQLLIHKQLLFRRELHSPLSSPYTVH